MFDFFCVCQQGKIDDSFGLKIHNRHRRVNRLTRSCIEEKFLFYFEKIVDHENDYEVKITNVRKSAASDISNAELTLVAKEIQKSGNQKVKYQKAVPEAIKKVGMYAEVYGIASAIKKFSSKYTNYNFNRTTVNSWKAKYKVANPTFKKAGRLICWI